MFSPNWTSAKQLTSRDLHENCLEKDDKRTFSRVRVAKVSSPFPSRFIIRMLITFSALALSDVRECKWCVRQEKLKFLWYKISSSVTNVQRDSNETRSVIVSMAFSDDNSLPELTGIVCHFFSNSWNAANLIMKKWFFVPKRLERDRNLFVNGMK